MYYYYTVATLILQKLLLHGWRERNLGLAINSERRNSMLYEMTINSRSKEVIC